MAEVSSARSILGGSVGPKARPKGVADGQTVDIPSPRADVRVRTEDGAQRAERRAGDAASARAGPPPARVVDRGARKGSLQGLPIRSGCAPEKSPVREAA